MNQLFLPFQFLLGTEIFAQSLSPEDLLTLSQSQSQEDDPNDKDYFPPSGSDSSILSGFSQVRKIIVCKMVYNFQNHNTG